MTTQPKIELEKIGSGDEAIYLTVDKIIEFANEFSKNEQIRKIARGILRKSDRSEEQIARGIFKWVIDNIKYKYDERIVEDYYPNWKPVKRTEYLQTPVRLIQSGVGDCDDLAAIVASLAKTPEIDMFVSIKIIATKQNEKFLVGGGTKNYTHVYCELGFIETWSKPYWIPVDTVMTQLSHYKYNPMVAFGQEADDIVRQKIYEFI